MSHGFDHNSRKDTTRCERVPWTMMWKEKICAAFWDFILVRMSRGQFIVDNMRDEKFPLCFKLGLLKKAARATNFE